MSHASHVSKALSGIPAASFLSTAPLFSLEASTSLKEALKAMHDRGITGAPVYVDDVTGVSDRGLYQSCSGKELASLACSPFRDRSLTPLLVLHATRVFIVCGPSSRRGMGAQCGSAWWGVGVGDHGGGGG